MYGTNLTQQKTLAKASYSLNGERQKPFFEMRFNRFDLTSDLTYHYHILSHDKAKGPTLSEIVAAHHLLPFCFSLPLRLSLRLLGVPWGPWHIRRRSAFQAVWALAATVGSRRRSRLSEVCWISPSSWVACVSYQPIMTSRKWNTRFVQFSLLGAGLKETHLDPVEKLQSWCRDVWHVKIPGWLQWWPSSVRPASQVLSRKVSRSWLPL